MKLISENKAAEIIKANIRSTFTFKISHGKFIDFYDSRKSHTTPYSVIGKTATKKLEAMGFQLFPEKA